jgi:hypothetical protein
LNKTKKEIDVAHLMRSHPKRRKTKAHYPNANCISDSSIKRTEGTPKNYNYNNNTITQRYTCKNMQLPYSNQMTNDNVRNPFPDAYGFLYSGDQKRRTIEPQHRLDMVQSNGTFSYDRTSSHNYQFPRTEQQHVQQGGDDTYDDDEDDSTINSADFSSDLFDPIPWDIDTNEPKVAMINPRQIPANYLDHSSNNNTYPPHPPQTVEFPPVSQKRAEFYQSSYHGTTMTPPFVPSADTIPISNFSSPSYRDNCLIRPYQYNFVTPQQTIGEEWKNTTNTSQRQPYSSISFPPILSEKSDVKIPVKKTKSSRKRQPRPKIFVLQGQGGVVYDPKPNDILSGRGGRINSHIGNVRYRQLVAQYKKVYLDPHTKKLEKSHIAADIVYQIRQRGGRFLAEADDGSWHEVGDVRAIRKTGQALREFAQTIRIAHSNDENEKQGSVASRSTTSTASTHTQSNIVSGSNTYVNDVPKMLSVVPSPFPLTDADRIESVGTLGTIDSINTVMTDSTSSPLDKWVLSDIFSNSSL